MRQYDNPQQWPVLYWNKKKKKKRLQIKFILTDTAIYCVYSAMSNKWPTWYSWNIVEISAKHDNPNANPWTSDKFAKLIGKPKAQITSTI